MARLARVVVPGYPLHITQRGNRRQQTFFSDEDYEPYIALMAEKMCKHEQTGRPLGDTSFVAKLEKILQRVLKPQKPGPKPQ